MSSLDSDSGKRSLRHLADCSVPIDDQSLQERLDKPQRLIRYREDPFSPAFDPENINLPEICATVDRGSIQLETTAVDALSAVCDVFCKNNGAVIIEWFQRNGAEVDSFVPRSLSLHLIGGSELSRVFRVTGQFGESLRSVVVTVSDSIASQDGLRTQYEALYHSWFDTEGNERSARAREIVCPLGIAVANDTRGTVIFATSFLDGYEELNRDERGFSLNRFTAGVNQRLDEYLNPFIELKCARAVAGVFASTVDEDHSVGLVPAFSFSNGSFVMKGFAEGGFEVGVVSWQKLVAGDRAALVASLLRDNGLNLSDTSGGLAIMRPEPASTGTIVRALEEGFTQRFGSEAPGKAVDCIREFCDRHPKLIDRIRSELSSYVPSQRNLGGIEGFDYLEEDTSFMTKLYLPFLSANQSNQPLPDAQELLRYWDSILNTYSYSGLIQELRRI